MITTDIETVPTIHPSDLERIKSKVKPRKQIDKAKLAQPKSLKADKSIKAWWDDADKVEKAKSDIETSFRDAKAEEDKRFENDFRKGQESTSFNGGYGQIYCIGYAIDDQEPECLSQSDGLSEYQVLSKFNTVCSGYGDQIYFIGHNLHAFDMTFLAHRMFVHQIKPRFQNPYNSPYWKSNCFDTWIEWKGQGFNKYPNNSGMKLDDLCYYLEIPTPKDGIDGSMVWQTVKEGNGHLVAKYCKKDVVATREVYKKLTFEGKEYE